MKIIQLLHTAAAIAKAVGTADGANDRRRGLRRLQNDGNDPTPPAPASNITCAADETPCHIETGDTESCAKAGETCPCYYTELQCSDPHFGEYCDSICCEWGVQERCHQQSSDPGYFDVFCASLASGGCPCPEGQTKCGRVMAHDGTVTSTGYCTSVCCDGLDEHGQQLQEQCFDENYDVSSCALIAQGGCPCPEGQTKCGSTEKWAGYCTDVCCGADEEACYDDAGKKSCSKKSKEEGCGSAGKSIGHWRSRVASTILAQGTGGQISYYSSIKDRKEKLLSLAQAQTTPAETLMPEVHHLIKHLEEEEAALFHAIRLGKKKRPAANSGGDEIVFSIL